MRRLRALVALLLGMTLLTGCDFDVYQMPLPGGPDAGDDPIEVKVEFADVLDLVPRSSVKYNEVSVGQVTDIDVKGYTALVTIEVRNDIGLPDNATASIRQTSLLGEKFVSLEDPAGAPSGEPLGDGDTIPLERTGRNPEVEEVLGALSLVLNGGGVAQMKTIATELNLALEGREDSARSVLNQIESLMGQLDDRKTDIVDAIESLNRLSLGVREHQTSIDRALEELPSALDSLDRQREDLVRMLRALNRLGDVGVRVIDATERLTIRSLQELEPVLMQINRAGDSFAQAFSTFLSFPFVDEVVGADPQVARRLDMGDYVNLSVELDMNLADLQTPGVPVCHDLEDLEGTPINQILNMEDLCEGVQDVVRACAADPSLERCPDWLVAAVCDSATGSVAEICDGLLEGLNLNGGNNDGGGGVLDDLGSNLGGLGLNRAPFGPPGERRTLEDLARRHDPVLVGLLGGPLVGEGAAR